MPPRNPRPSKPLIALSAIKLQRAWRKTLSHRTTRRIVERNQSVGATAQFVQSISFASLTTFLREKNVIDAGKACLQRIHLLSTFRHGSPSKALIPENVNVRVFLAGYMIVYNQTDVFESIGRLEQTLIDSAKPLLVSFQDICKHIQCSKHHSFAEVPGELTKRFPTQLFDYLKSFKAWKTPDEQKLVCRIKCALEALYQALHHLPFDEPSDSKLAQDFHTQIASLRSKLLQIGGPDAVAQFDEQRAKDETQQPTRCSGGGSGATLPGRLTNEQLAHELLLDLKFTLDEDGESPCYDRTVYQRIRETFHRAFWDSIVADLKLATPTYGRVLRLLKEIRSGIVDLAGSREAGAIAEIVDLDFIRQQVDGGYYDFASCKSLIGGIVDVISRIQAPKRDEETKEKWAEVKKGLDTASAEDKPQAIASALEFLLNRVNALRIDAANARLRLIAPVIALHGIEYERDKLNQKLQDGTLTLERATAWIDKAIKEQPEAALEGLAAGRGASYVDVHIDAMMSLVVSPVQIRQDLLPETLLLDVGHLAHMQQEFNYVTSAAAMMVTVVDSAQLTQATLEKVSKLFLDEKTVNMDVGDVVDRIDGELHDAGIEARRKARRTLPGCADAGNPVKQLMHNRLKQVLRNAVRTGSVNLLGATRLLAPRIQKMAAKLAHVGKINRDVHTPIYNKLIRDAMRALQR